MGLIDTLFPAKQPASLAPKAGMEPMQTAPRLMDIQLPAGDVQGFDIDYSAGTGRRKYTSAEWLDKGFDGVRFIGAGRLATRIRPVGDQAVLVDRHNGIVRFENLTLLCGARQGIWFGLEHKDQPIAPKFALHMKQVEVTTDGTLPNQQHGTVWPLFGYQSDVWLEDVTISARFSAEHASYWHGFAKDGLRWNRVAVPASGAESCKVRNSPSETAWVPGARIWLTACRLGDWYQPWSWRGGGGLVVQGGGSDIIVQGCLFQGGGQLEGPPMIPASQRTRAIMIDDSGGDFFSATDGKVGRGFANGHVLIRGCGFAAGPGNENLSQVIRVGSLGSGQKVARTLNIEGCAVYGERLQLQLTDIPSGRLNVRGCNTPAIKDLASMIGLDTRHEALIPLADRLSPVSAGLTR